MYLLLTPAVCSMLFQLPILFLLGLRNQYFFLLCYSNVWKLCRRFLSASFSPVCRPFFEQAGELGVKLRHVVHEIDWSVLFLLMFQIWYLRKWIITSISQNLHMRVTRFKSLWVSATIYKCLHLANYLKYLKELLTVRPSIYNLNLVFPRFVRLMKAVELNSTEASFFITQELSLSIFYLDQARTVKFMLVTRQTQM